MRDVGHTVSIVTTALLFLSPVFYPISHLPEAARGALMLNPLTLIIQEVRDVLLWGVPPNWIALGVYTSVSIVVAWAGLYLFQKTRCGFADVL